VARLSPGYLDGLKYDKAVNPDSFTRVQGTTTAK
jgi:hypothetical protein